MPETFTQATTEPQEKVSYNVFMGVLWSFVALTLCSVILRIGIRLKMFGRLLWDDVCVISSWLMFFISAILYRVNISRPYRYNDAVQGKAALDQKTVANWDYLVPVTVTMALNILFYSSLWAVKFSFLIFFQKLGDKMVNYRIWWWVVLVFTMACYIGCIADFPYKCAHAVKVKSHNLQSCLAPEFVSWAIKTLYINCGLDLASDLLILSIPILILWNTGVPLRKKLILFSIFSATVAVMIVSIIRVTITNTPRQALDPAWLSLWNSVEVGTAILIASVTSFRQLFVATTHEDFSNSSSNNNNSKRIMRLFNSAGKSNTQSMSSPGRPLPGILLDTDPERGQRQDYINPLEFITMANTYSSSDSDQNSDGGSRRSEHAGTT